MLAWGIVPGPLLSQKSGSGLPPAPSFTVRKATGPIVIDGKLDDEGWRGADDISLDWEVAPGDNEPSKVKTICHVSFDADNLFVGCHAYDPKPKEIRAHVLDRDNVSKLVLDDLVGVYIDPFNDQRRAFLFVVNPFGVQADGIRTVSEQSEDYSWDATWKSVGRIMEDGFQVEIAVPFKSLRFPRSTSPQTWGFVFARSWPRNVRYRMEAGPLDRSSTCDLCQANKLTGFEGIAPGRNVELAPTLTGRRTDSRLAFPNGPLEKGNASPELGGDLHWGITPNVSLNVTAHPDFSQVEADAALLDANKRFALFYPEKRPFFLEGADIFASPIQAVFTRTVADPDGGLKITGKVGASTKNVVGVFAARDRLTNLLIPSNQGTAQLTLDQEAWTTVGRFRRDIGAASNVSVLYTGRFGPGYLNQVAGADFFYQLGRSTRINGQYLTSVTEYPDSIARQFGQRAGTMTGGGLALALNYGTNHWQAQATYQDLSPEFRADVGFVPRVDTRTLTVGINPIFYRPRGWFTSLAIGPYLMRVEDHRGVLTDQDIGGGVYYNGPWQSSLYTQLFEHKERFLDRLYRFGRWTGYLELKPGAGFALIGQWQVGGAIDYGNARQAHEVTVTPTVQLSVGRSIAVDVSNAYQRLSTAGKEILTANILQSKVAYNFNVRTQLRAIVQYRDVHRNLALFQVPASEEERSLLGQFLFSYRVNPQTVLFVGYSENGLANENYDLTRASRTFFAKIGYAWRP